MSECTICAEAYNKSTRKRVGCEYCDFEACQSCVRTYLLDKPEPKCMSSACDRIWTRKFLSQNLPVSFINKEFRPHLSAVQFELEKSRLPMSQITLELENTVNRLTEEEYEIKSKINELRQRIADITNERTHLKARINNRYQGVEDTGEVNSGAQQRAKFVRACPANDCRGYLSTQWKCGVCSKYTCPDCHEVKGAHDAEHTCDPNVLASAQAIAKDSKHCPNCSVMIFRIAGCNHMFCTACHTGFDWKTGKIIRGSVGNPHYYEYMAQRGARHVPTTGVINPCAPDNTTIIRNIHTLINVVSGNHVYNRNPTRYVEMRKIVEQAEKDAELNKHSNHIFKTTENMVMWLNATMGNVADTEDNILTERFRETEEHKAMEKLRVRYLRRELNEEEFRMAIQKHTQKVAIKREIRAIISMSVEALKDIIARMVNEYAHTLTNVNAYYALPENVRRKQALKEYAQSLVEDHKRAIVIWEEYKGLRTYVNENIVEVLNTYHSSAMPYQMRENGRFTIVDPRQTAT